MKFLANENFPAASIQSMRNAGFDVESVSEIMASVSDNVVLQKAVDGGQIILTFDKDYGHLIFRDKNPVPPGVIFFRFNPATPTEPFEVLSKFLSGPGAETEGWFIVMERDVARKRKL